MSKIFIDTNIFLGLYESNTNSLTIFKDIRQVEENLVIPDQVISEFLRNRDLILLTLIDNVKKNFQLSLHTTSLVRRSEIFQKFYTLQENFKSFKEILIQELEEIKDNPQKDPIYKSFIELCNDKKILRLDTDDEIIKKAQKRNLLGNPPNTPKKGTICDEIIWELLLNNINDDLFIISGDGTFSSHITFLREEFRKKTNNTLTVKENLSEILTLFGVKPSKNAIKFDKEQEKIREISKSEIPSIKNISPTIGGSTISDIYKDTGITAIRDIYKDTGISAISDIFKNTGVSGMNHKILNEKALKKAESPNKLSKNTSKRDKKKSSQKK